MGKSWAPFGKFLRLFFSLARKKFGAEKIAFSIKQRRERRDAACLHAKILQRGKRPSAGFKCWRKTQPSLGLWSRRAYALEKWMEGVAKSSIKPHSLWTHLDHF
jgi:hypothetical protein